MILKAPSSCSIEIPPSFCFSTAFDLTVFSDLSRLFKLKNGKNTPKLTKIALDFVKIQYNRPEL